MLLFYCRDARVGGRFDTGSLSLNPVVAVHFKPRTLTWQKPVVLKAMYHSPHPQGQLLNLHIHPAIAFTFPAGSVAFPLHMESIA